MRLASSTPTMPVPATAPALPCVRATTGTTRAAARKLPSPVCRRRRPPARPSGQHHGAGPGQRQERPERHRQPPPPGAAQPRGPVVAGDPGGGGHRAEDRPLTPGEQRTDGPLGDVAHPGHRQRPEPRHLVQRRAGHGAAPHLAQIDVDPVAGGDVRERDRPRGPGRRHDDGRREARRPVPRLRYGDVRRARRSHAVTFRHASTPGGVRSNIPPFLRRRGRPIADLHPD